jgi:hypothetical protein
LPLDPDETSVESAFREDQCRVEEQLHSYVLCVAGQPDGGIEEGELGPLEQLAEERRRESDKMMWQVPGLSIAAQAFLYSRAFDAATSPLAQGAIATVALAIALATIQLLMKHSYFEETYSWALDAFRERRGATRLNGGRVFEDAAAAHAEVLQEYGDDRERTGAQRYLRWRAKRAHRSLVVEQPARTVWIRAFWLLVVVDCAVLATALVRHFS